MARLSVPNVRDLVPEIYPLFICNVGSVNYNLGTSASDLDVKIFCIPTFAELYNAEYISSSFSKVIDGVDYDFDVKDVRLLSDLLYKSNCNYLEMLFSNTLDYNNQVTDSCISNFIYYLIKHRDDFAKANLKYLYSSSLGTMNSRVKMLTNATLCDDKTSIQMHKCAYHVLRLYRMLKVFEESNFTDFKSAIYYDIGAERNDILNLKNRVNKLTQADLISIVNDIVNKTILLRDAYYSQSINSTLFDELKLNIYDLVKNYN